jgi:subtilisin family serine protease
MSVPAFVAAPIRIAVLDSGVHLAHPHIGGVVDGADCTQGELPRQGREFLIDRLGHGTAVAALIHHLAPEAELVVARIFDRQLSTSISTVLRAIEWSLEQNVQILNLSFGTQNPAHRESFERVIACAAEAGVVIVSAYEAGGQPVLPGSLAGVLGVVEAECPQLEYRVYRDESGLRFGASPYPRSIPGVPMERNLHGVSFATAALSAQVARFWRQRGPQADWPAFLEQELACTGN